MPDPGNALELVLTAVLELDPRPRHQILDRGGHKYLTRGRRVGDAGADVYGETCDIVVTDFNLPVCTPTRTSMASARTASRMAMAQWMARPGPSNVARNPSPAVLTSFP